MDPGHRQRQRDKGTRYRVKPTERKATVDTERGGTITKREKRLGPAYVVKKPLGEGTQDSGSAL